MEPVIKILIADDYRILGRSWLYPGFKALYQSASTPKFKGVTVEVGKRLPPIDYCHTRLKNIEQKGSPKSISTQQNNLQKNVMSYIKAGTDAQGNDINLFYSDLSQGQASQTVVLIHGWPLSHEMWEYQLTELPKHNLRVVAYDRRGFGKSSKPFGPYDYDTLADDLKAVLDELNLDNVTLVGFSMGGGEIARYMSRHGGKRVAKAVLVSAVTPYMLKTDDNPDGVDKSTFDEILANIQKDRANFLQTFSKQFYGVNMMSNPVSQAHLDGDFFRAYLASPIATIECAKAFAMTDFRDDLRHFNVPTLIIHGDDDKTVPIEASGERTAELLPNAQYIVYSGAPHGLYVTEKDRLNRDLLTFIQAGVDYRQPVNRTVNY